MGIHAGGGVFGLGNPGGRGGLAVSEIRAHGGVKSCHPSGVCGFFLEYSNPLISDVKSSRMAHQCQHLTLVSVA